MKSLSLTTSTTTTAGSNPSIFRYSVPCFSNPRRYNNLSFPHKPKKFMVFASKDEHNLDNWDLMELKFGKLIGEDPKLTMAKVIGKKLNPEMSYLEIEKLFRKKGKAGFDDIEEVPFDVSEVRKPSNSLSGLNLVRPVPKKGVKFETNEKPSLPKVKRPSQTVPKAVDNPRRSVPNVILRKPTTFSEDDVGTKNSPRLSVRPNLSLKMGKEESKERFTHMTLVRRPEPFIVKDEEEPIGEAKAESTIDNGETSMESVSVNRQTATDVSLLQKPEMNVDFNSNQIPETSGGCSGSGSDIDGSEISSKSMDLAAEMVNATKSFFDPSVGIGHVSKLQDYEQENDFLTGSQPFEKNDVGSADKKSFRDSDTKLAIQGKPERLDQSVKRISNSSEETVDLVNPEHFGKAVEHENSPATPVLKECENTDWTRAEDLFKTGGREEVEVISSSTRGFVVSFGSLIGFLPYRNLATKWKYLAFESWLRRKGLDPSMYRQNLGIIGSYEAPSKITFPDSSAESIFVNKVEDEISPDMKLEDLLVIYDQEKLKYLSSFVGQKIKVNMVLADRESKRLIFSVKPKEKEESIEKKRSLMAKLSVGDVVKCCIKKITYFGIFVEVEGVPALIHQTEVSWDATLDAASYFKIGQVVDAKVHQLDFSLERIFLSLKEIMPDPLIETLEAVVGDYASLDGRLQAAEADNEWADVESLVKELQQYDGVQSVSKGRFFLSPGLAPTFQVYMASMFEDQYKLLARSGNKIQEVIVQTSMGKEEMKSAILTCANRVE